MIGLCKDWQPVKLDHYSPELSSCFEAAERQNFCDLIEGIVAAEELRSRSASFGRPIFGARKNVGEFRPQDGEGDGLAFCSREYARSSEGGGRPVGAWPRPHSARFPGFSSPFPETLWRKVPRAAR